MNVVTIISLAIAFLSLIASLYFNTSGKKRGDIAEIERKAGEMAMLNTKLDQIGNDVKDIKYDMSATKKEVQALSERLVKVEESTKQAHKRLDEYGKES